MRMLIYLFILLLIAVGLGFLIQQDPGYIVIGYHHWTLASSLWVGVAIVIVAFIVVYLVIRLCRNIAGMPRFFSKRRLKINLQRYQKMVSESVADMAVGDFRKAEKKLTKLAHKTPDYTTYLLAAKAAQAQLAYARRDEYFKQAFQLAKDNTLPVSLTQARYYLAAEQTDEALTLFKQLYKTAPKNNLVLNGLKVIYFKQQDWQSLQLILPELKKQKLMTAQECAEMKLD